MLIGVKRIAVLQKKTQFLPQQQRSGMRCELAFDNHRLFVWKFDAGHENVCGWKTEEDQKNVNIILQLQSARCLKGKILLIGLSSHRDVREARVMPAGIGRRQIPCRIIKGPMCRINEDLMTETIHNYVLIGVVHVHLQLMIVFSLW